MEPRATRQLTFHGAVVTLVGLLGGVVLHADTKDVSSPHDLILRRRARHLRELVEDEGDVDRQELAVADPDDVPHAALVEEAAVRLAARARLRVPADQILEVVAEEEVVLLEDGDHEVPALSVAARAPAVPVDHLDDGEVLG